MEVLAHTDPRIGQYFFAELSFEGLDVSFWIVFTFKLVVVDRLLVEVHFYFFLDVTTAWPDRVCVV